MFKLQDLQSTESWGPGDEWHLDGVLKDVPFAPFSKGDKLGRAADWTAEAKDGRDARSRSGYNRNYRDQYQAYGAGAASSFAYQHGEDEASFSVVDSRSVPKPRTYNRLGTANRGARGTGQRGTRGQFQRLGGRAGGRGGWQQGGRWGQGFRGRRFGWKDYDKPQRLRDASIQIKSDWKLLEEIEFSRLSKLNFPAVGGEDVETAGFVYQYDKTFDRLSPRNSKPLQVIEKAIYNPTTTDDPMMEQLSESNAATVFATDSILSMMMCANRSVYPWDIVVVRDGDKVYFDKRPNSAFDYVTVNENAVEPPLEVAEGTKDQINTAGQLSSEATFIIQNFSQQALKETSAEKYEFQHPNPFNVEDEEPETLASRGYRYRKFDLTTEDDGDDEVTLIVRTEVDGFIKSSGGDDQFITIKALNEFDSKSHAAIDWRSKLDSQRGAVVATEMKNNSCKLARWAMQSVLAGAAFMKIGYVSRVTPRDNSKHVILAVGTYKPKDFAAQMNVQLPNAWGIVRAIIDVCRKRPDGKYVLVKDPNKPILRFYDVPQDDEQLNGYPEEEQQETQGSEP